MWISKQPILIWQAAQPKFKMYPVRSCLFHPFKKLYYLATITSIVIAYLTPSSRLGILVSDITLNEYYVWQSQSTSRSWWWYACMHQLIVVASNHKYQNRPTDSKHWGQWLRTASCGYEATRHQSTSTNACWSNVSLIGCSCNMWPLKTYSSYQTNCTLVTPLLLGRPYSLHPNGLATIEQTILFVGTNASCWFKQLQYERRWNRSHFGRQHWNVW